MDVSVITPCYNGEEYLDQCIACVANQSGPYVIEHLVVDDCSKDRSWIRLQELADTHTKLIPLRNPTNMGPGPSRNRAIKAARGRFLCFLDIDDIWSSSKVASQVSFMRRTGATFTFHDYRHMSTDGKQVGRLITGPNEIDFAVHHRSRRLLCSTVMIDGEAHPDFSFPRDNLELLGEDFLAFARLLRTTKSAVRIAKDLTRYRLVPKSRSARKLQAARCVWQIYRKVERLPLLTASTWFARYVVDSSMKHFTCYPAYDRRLVDGVATESTNKQYVTR